MAMPLRTQFTNKIEGLRFELARLNNKLLDVKNTNSLKKFKQLRRKGASQDENLDEGLEIDIKIRATQKEIEIWEIIFQAEEQQVKTLNISRLELTKLPEGVFYLTDLTSLDLGENQLTALPPEIGNLTKLTNLDLSNNLLKSLPAEIEKLSALRRLEVSGNHLEFIPEGIGKLRNLIELRAPANRLISLPSSFFELINLEILTIGDNHLNTLPPEIGQLRSLRELFINRLPISYLPNEMMRLTQLKELDLRGSSIPIPLEILERINDPQTILNYYSDTVADEKTQFRVKPKTLNEIKLLIVGQGSVGKTSLVQQILHRTFDLNQIKTEGISIKQWTIDYRQQTMPKDSSSMVDGQSSIKLNIWDFGGHEIMHATHQFFLTKRSLYLLVLDARLTQEENRVEYWLKIIQSFGGESPVLIVGNKTDQHPLDIDRTGLQKKYPNIVGILETSAATGAGIETLKAEIAKQVDILPHVRDLLPETWFIVKSKLEELAKNKNFFTQDEYFSLCDTNDVKDETSQHTLIGFLHDLGVVLHFQDDPRLEALGILNPQWVTNGVYKILNSHELFQNQGQLTLPLLNKILNLPEYPSNKRLFIVDMMKKFELCYDIETDKSFLIPDLLPKDEPIGIDINGVSAFQYQYPVLPSSVITRFIVRMNKHIANNVAWRTGVVLKIGDNQALVKADAEDKKISIYIEGLEHKRRDVLSAIRYQFDEIHDTIKGLNPQKRVPIPEAPGAEPLEYDYLLQLERDGFDQHPVKDGNRLVKVDVRKLLSGIESEAKLKESAANITNIYVGGDVSGNLIVGNDNEAGANTSKRKAKRKP